MPQWIPQNIQKRLLLYVLQQLLLFSEIDLPNLEEVSLNNIQLRDIPIDPEKVGKLPGCNLRFGRVGYLELSGVRGGVSVELANVEVVVAPEFDAGADASDSHVTFLLAKSTADLAHTVMEREPEEDDVVRERRPSTGSSALGGVMGKAVEMALLRLQVRVTDLRIKIVSELTDILVQVDEAVVSTTNGTRNIKIRGIRALTLRPDVNPGDLGPENSNSGVLDATSGANNDQSLDSKENSDVSDTDDDGYGDESLLDSMVFTHEEASSIYLSATLQSFEKGSQSVPLKAKERPESDLPVIFHIDEVRLLFEGLSEMTNLELDVHQFKVAAVPLTPTVSSILTSISRSFKLASHQMRKNASKYRPNSRFPQYADEDDEISYEEDDKDTLEKAFFNKLHIADIIVSATSALLPTGEFASLSNNLQLHLHNTNIKQKSDILLYGGAEIFDVLHFVNGIPNKVFSFENQTQAVPLPDPNAETASSGSSVKADVRFEVFKKLENGKETMETTVLFSKPAVANLDAPSLLILSHFSIALSTMHKEVSALQSTISSNQNIAATSSKRVSESNNSVERQFILQTATLAVKTVLSDILNISLFALPISFNMRNELMTIPKVTLTSTIKGQECPFLTVSNIQLATKLQEFSAFTTRAPSDFPRESRFSSGLHLFVQKVKGSTSLTNFLALVDELKTFISALTSLPLQVNSLENSISPENSVRGDFSQPKKLNNSSLLGSSIYSSQRRSRRSGPSLTASTLIGVNRVTAASLKLFIKETEFAIHDLSSKFGSLHFHISLVLIYTLPNDIHGSILSLGIHRRFEPHSINEKLLYEFQNKTPEETKSPLVLVHVKNSDKLKIVDFIFRNFALEYYTLWPSLLESELPEHPVEAVRVSSSSSEPRGSETRLFDFRFTFHDCIVGLNPGRLNAKLYVVVSKANSDITFGLDQFYVKSSLRNTNLLLIDDIENATDSASHTTKKASTSYISPLSWLTERGYLSVGTVNSTHVGVTISTDVDEIKKRNERLGIYGALLLVNVKINSDEQQLDLCADSAHTLVQLLVDLKVPVIFTDEEKFRVRVVGNVNVLEDVLEENLLGQITISDKPSQLKINGLKSIDEHFSVVDLTQEMGAHMSKLSIKSETDESLYFNEGHFAHGGHAEEIGIFPITANINLSKTSIYLYDGYDWKETRKVIKGAVKRVEAKARKEHAKKTLERMNSEAPERASGKASGVKFNLPEASEGEYHNVTFTEEHTHENESENDEANSADENISETLFQSIHLGLPRGSNPTILTENINSMVQNTSNLQDEEPNKAINVNLGKNYKNLKLRRSKYHKVQADLSNIEVNATIMTTRDPRKELPAKKDSFETVNSVDVKVDTVDVYDNVPTSSWNKLLTYMSILGDREVGTSMLKLSLTNVRPDPELCGMEAIIKLSILPLRLHIDQDTLDFLTRFFDFKDGRFVLPLDDILYIQKFSISPLKLKLDYKPKKLDYAGIRSGNSSELMNIFILDGSTLSLTGATLYGQLGIPQLSRSLMRAWAPSIQQTQLVGLLLGILPIASIVNIGSGVKDLVTIPIKEYKKDGRLLRSLQKGTSSFAKTTGYELLRLGVKLAAGTQVLLEYSEEAFGGEGAAARKEKHGKKEPEEEAGSSGERRAQNLLESSHILTKGMPVEKDQNRSRRLYVDMDLDEGHDIDRSMFGKSSILLLNEDKDIVGELALEEESEPLEKQVSLYSDQPENAQQGLKLAYRAFGKNIESTKKTLAKLRDDIVASESLQEQLFSVLKLSPVILIRPIIGTTEAVLKTLMGLSNEINSLHIVEGHDKYRSSLKGEN